MQRMSGTSPTLSPEAASTAAVASWDSVVRQHSSRVFRLAYRLTGNRADAEDLTQEVLVRALRSPGAGSSGSSGSSGAVEGWFHRVTTNLFVDMVRRRNRVRATSLEERPWALEPADAAADPSALAMTTVLDPDVEAALATLSPAFREAVLLCDVHGLSYAEIGALVGAKSGTVRSRIHRGRAMLRTALAHRAPAPGRRRHGGPQDQVPGPRRPLATVAASGTMAG
jgi:RNA polymerase sigma factor (sigma-70 family)